MQFLNLNTSSTNLVYALKKYLIKDHSERRAEVTATRWVKLIFYCLMLKSAKLI